MQCTDALVAQVGNVQCMSPKRPGKEAGHRALLPFTVSTPDWSWSACLNIVAKCLAVTRIPMSLNADCRQTRDAQCHGICAVIYSAFIWYHCGYLGAAHNFDNYNSEARLAHHQLRLPNTARSVKILQRAVSGHATPSRLPLWNKQGEPWHHDGGQQ